MSSSLPPHKFANLPSLSPTMEVGKIATWEKKEGDKLSEGDVLCQIETDKAVMAMETPHTGYLAKIIIEEGTKDIAINQPIAIIVKKKEDIDKFKDYVPDLNPKASTKKIDPEPKIEKTTVQTKNEENNTVSTIKPSVKLDSGSSDRIIASPYAKKLAREQNLNLSHIQGSGLGGRIVASDIKPDIVHSVASSNIFTDIDLTSMRSAIAKRLVLSKTSIPHFYLSMDVNIEPLMAIRSHINSQMSDKIKLSINDFIIKACAKTLMDVPECNSQWMDTFIRRFHQADISVAVSTDSGLITPIVFDASNKTLSKISTEVKSLAEKAKANQLKPAEFQGGTFTVSNLGMYGITQFTAIINPPQSCILAVGCPQKKIIVDPLDKIESFKNIITFTLACDHRVVDGAIGADWLNKFKFYIENPYSLMI